MAYNLGSLFTLYIQMRQQGRIMDDVVSRLQDAAQQLPRDDRRRLGELVMEWEDKYGKDPRQSPVPTPVEEPAPVSIIARVTAPVNAQPTAQPAVQPIAQPKQSLNPAVFGTRFLDPAKLATLARPAEQPTIPCPSCGKPNSPTSNVCKSCGQSLQFQPKSAPQTRRLDDTTVKKAALVAAYFPPEATLLIAIRGAKQVLEAYPRETMTIGRVSAIQHKAGQLFLDLSPFNGEALGVSRQHAEIRSINNTLVVVDLDSDNGTFINDVRLYPHEIRVLHNGDDLRVGGLSMKITFKQ